MQDITSMVRAPAKRVNLKTRRARRDARDFYLMISPWAIGFVLLWLFPLGLGLWLSFGNYNGLNWDSIKFVGFENYLRALKNPFFWKALANTFRYMLIVVPGYNVIALGLALLLNQKIKGRNLFRLLYYLPAIVPLIGAVKTWALMWNKNSGLVNAFISFFRPGTAINWLGNEYFLVLYLFVFWGVGGAMTIYLAGLQGIPQDLKEAAQLDGANRVQAFMKVTLPLLTPTVFLQLVLGVIYSLQVMAEAVLLYPRISSAGAVTVQVPQRYYMSMVYVFSEAFDYSRFGYGVALSWLLFIVILVLTVLIISTAKYWVHYEVSQEGEN